MRLRIALILMTFYVVALSLFVAASFLSQITSQLLSVCLLIPLYVWLGIHPREKLARETNGRSKNVILFWIFALFALALSVRIPSVLLFNSPYEKTPLIYLLILTMILIETTDPSAFGFRTENIEKLLLLGVTLFLFTRGIELLTTYFTVFIYTGMAPFVAYYPAYFLIAMPFHTLCVGISEEGLFRGYMQTHLEKFYTPQRAIFVQAFLFGLWHFVWDLRPFNPFGMMFYIGVTFLIGLLFGYFYSKTKNLLPLILAHGLYNSFVQGLASSREAFGAISEPTQILISLLSYAISAIATFLFIKYLVKKGSNSQKAP